MIIGICGKSGSGKSTLAKEIVSDLGTKAVHLDIDKVGHHVLTIPEVYNELEKSFGNKVANNKTINRKKLGELVFNNRENMKKLSNITWNFMQKEIDHFLNDNINKVIVLDWILLESSKYFAMCDITILLDVPYEDRKKRAMKRDNITDEAFDLREKASVNFNINNFNYIITNNNKEQIKRLVKSL